MDGYEKLAEETAEKMMEQLSGPLPKEANEKQVRKLAVISCNHIIDAAKLGNSKANDIEFYELVKSKINSHD